MAEAPLIDIHLSDLLDGFGLSGHLYLSGGHIHHHATLAYGVAGLPRVHLAPKPVC